MDKSWALLFADLGTFLDQAEVQDMLDLGGIVWLRLLQAIMLVVNQHRLFNTLIPSFIINSMSIFLLLISRFVCKIIGTTLGVERCLGKRIKRLLLLRAHLFDHRSIVSFRVLRVVASLKVDITCKRYHTSRVLDHWVVCGLGRSKRVNKSIAVHLSQDRDTSSKASFLD